MHIGIVGGTLNLLALIKKFLSKKNVQATCNNLKIFFFLVHQPPIEGNAKRGE